MAYKYHKEMLAKAQEMGFRSIDAAIVHLYSKLGSSWAVGEVFDRTGPAILYQLKKLGVPINQRGGDNHKKECRNDR